MNIHFFNDNVEWTFISLMITLNEHDDNDDAISFDDKIIPWRRINYVAGDFIK